LGYCDNLTRFGKDEASPTGDGGVLCVFEFKINGRRNSKYWYRNGGAMASQVYHGLIAHRAQIGFAVMPGGLYVVIKRDLGHGRARFQWWPKNMELFDYSTPRNKALLLQILVEIARIGAVVLPPNPVRYSMASENTSNIENEESSDESETPKKKRRRSPPLTEKKKREERSTGGPNGGDETFTMVGKDGSEVKLFSLDVKSRLTAKEIRRQREIHISRELEIPLSGSDFSGADESEEEDY
jgi:hypothetical protein